MVGVSKKYSSRAGHNYHQVKQKNFWCWNIHKNSLWIEGNTYKKYPTLNADIYDAYKIGDRIQLVLDCDNSTLHFEVYKNSEWMSLGIAFANLEKTMLYPTASTSICEGNVSLVYIGQR